MSNAGKKIIDGLKDAVAGNFSSVTIDGQTWVRKTPCPGCDGHECDNGCRYPGATRAASDRGKPGGEIVAWQHRTRPSKREPWSSWNEGKAAPTGWLFENRPLYTSPPAQARPDREALEGLYAWVGATRLGINDPEERAAFEDDKSIAERALAVPVIGSVPPEEKR